MSSVVVVGSQWGDEGKGKITDFLSKEAEVIARYQGGNNAGHTIRFNHETYKLHLIPSGIFYPEKKSIIFSKEWVADGHTCFVEDSTGEIVRVLPTFSEVFPEDWDVPVHPTTAFSSTGWSPRCRRRRLGRPGHFQR